MKAKYSKMKYGIVLNNGETHLFTKEKEAKKFYQKNKQHVFLFQSRNINICPWVLWNNNIIEHKGR